MIANKLTPEQQSTNDEHQDTFTRLIGDNPIKSAHQTTLIATLFKTPLGHMIAMANDDALYLLEFIERRALEPEIERLRQKTKSSIIQGKNAILEKIEQELSLYFSGRLTQFETPIKTIGSPFQHTVWQALQEIPCGKTMSYLDIAKAINRPTACRAVARANSTNQLAIIIPCHRVINSNGNLGGYAGGLERKKSLLELERNPK